MAAAIVAACALHAHPASAINAMPARRGNLFRNFMYKNIQALRFFAAFFVVLHHIPANTPFKENWLPPSVLEIGYFGVDIFFLISGFIMAESTSKIPRGGRAAWRFLAQRYGRIYLGWWPAFLLYALAYAWNPGWNPDFFSKNFLPSFLILPQPLMLYHLPIIWTLAHELYFYLILSFLILFGLAHRAGQIFLGLGIFVVCMNAWWFFRNMAPPHHVLHFLVSPYLLEFSLGFWLSRLTLLSRRPRAIGGRHFSWFVIGAAVMMGLGWYLQNFQKFNFLRFFDFGGRVLVWGGASACLLACALWLDRRGVNPIRVLPKLGDASYSMYLIHILVMNVMTLLYFRFQHHLAAWRFAHDAWVLATVLAVLVASLAAHALVERPLYGYFKRWLRMV